MAKTVLNLTATDAKKFFLSEDSYHNFDLPPYIKFDKLLSVLNKKIGKKLLDNCIVDNSHNPKNYENVNYKLFGNKNGKYDWRKFQLIHPLLYILLVNQITEVKNWSYIKKRFKEYRKNKNIQCASIPVVSSGKMSNKGKQIESWLHEVEQRSLELSLKYNYLYKLDISSYYGSIYTHSIAWALHGRDTAKAQKRDKTLIGNQIDESLMSMSYGQTNGIPEGSVLIDFISEMVLGYADELVTTQLKKIRGITGKYFILRYRDDYKIFTNNPMIGDTIIRVLTEVLIELGLKINPSKTVRSQSVLIDSLKEGKLGWLEFSLDNLSGIKSYTKILQILHLFADKFPNSGTLLTKLTALFKRIKIEIKITENIKVIVAYLVDIAIKNPITYPTCTGILSKLLTLVNNKKLKRELINDIYEKIISIPNTGFLEIWLQRMLIKEDLISFDYIENLCKIVNGTNETLWESDWLKPAFKKVIDSTSIIDNTILNNIDSVIDPIEINPFIYQN